MVFRTRQTGPDAVDGLEKLRHDPAALQDVFVRMGAYDDRPVMIDNYEMCEPMAADDPALLGLPDNQWPDKD